MTVALIAVALALAFANGSNDNFKGVATLYGVGRLSYRSALTFATASTLAGALAALALAAGLARRFSGRGLVPDSALAEPAFALSVGAGAALAVLIAARVGMPVSTTHALTGALVGSGVVVAGGGNVSFGTLASSFALPLLLSPAAALALAAALQRGLGMLEPACLCAAPLALQPIPFGPESQFGEPRVAPLLGTVAHCEHQGVRRLATWDVRKAADGLHLLSAGAVGFARGLNDTPKIAALLLTASALPPGLAVWGVAVAMGVGGWFGARRVAQTLSFGITGMDDLDGLGANLVTALLVVLASPLGLPVSTTHVSCGALLGIGALNGRARWRAIGTILGAWILTLPAGAILAGIAALALGAP